MVTLGDPRKTRQWKKLRARVLEGNDVCHICGGLIDFDAPAKTRWAPTVDHLVAIASGGDPFDEDNCLPAHHGCNASKGDGQGNRAVKTSQHSREW